MSPDLDVATLKEVLADAVRREAYTFFGMETITWLAVPIAQAYVPQSIRDRSTPGWPKTATLSQPRGLGFTTVARSLDHVLQLGFQPGRNLLDGTYWL